MGITLFWHRRDLRIEDNHGLYEALTSEKNVQPIFIFDKSILDKLEDIRDARVLFIHQQINRLKKQLQSLGSDMWVFYGTPKDVFAELIEKHQIDKVFTNRDYEPYAQNRDKEIYTFLESKKIKFVGNKDHVIFEKNEVVKDDGLPYLVFTPYSRKWKACLTDNTFAEFDTLAHAAHFNQNKTTTSSPSLSDMGFEDFDFAFPEVKLTPNQLKAYGDMRDIPSEKGTTKVSLSLRFGTVSIRSLANKGKKSSDKWLMELIWRDFYQMILFHFPHSVEGAFRPKYDKIPWRNDEKEFAAWCEGKTGYPIVDAGMRELNKTGFMHNRVRMVVASFLTKHLLIDWKWGERYFAKKLLDFDLASNVGGWQWASGSGCDAAPYFRVFNPTSQQEKFDKERKYIRRWVPEVDTKDYPAPIVEHKMARLRAIETYKQALTNQ